MDCSVLYLMLKMHTFLWSGLFIVVLDALDPRMPLWPKCERVAVESLLMSVDELRSCSEAQNPLMPSGHRSPVCV